MNKRFVSTFLIAFLICAASNSEALDVPARPEVHVNDYAFILSGEAGSAIEDTLSNFESKTTNQVVVAAFESLGEENLEDFSIRLAEKWRIGAKERDNGVILLIFKRDRQIRIEVGYGLEGALPDALCDSIIRNEIAPYFKKNDYDKGVMNGVAAIIKAISGEYKAGGGRQDTLNSVSGIFIVVIFFLIMGLSFYAEYRRKRSGYWGASSQGDYHGGWGSHYGGGFGGGGFGGGGFSGGGGGFGGGGSSGRW